MPSHHDGALVQLFKAASITPRAGDWVGEYELLRELGRGGEGVVFEARTRGIEHHVALKLLRDGRFASAECVRRFIRGAEATAQLEHPHIIPTQHFGMHEGQPFFTMRLVDAGSLAQRLSEREASRRLGQWTPALASWREDAALMATVAHAVHCAHQHGTLHRDLKPANILLDQDGTPYVADFGLAKQLDGDAHSEASQAVIGTLQYMPPEQARAEKQLTVAADVYSLGAILYELLTGRAPFAGAPHHELMQRITGPEPVTSPRALAPGLPKHLEVVCLKALNKSAAGRYESALALAQDLEAVAAGRPPSVPPLSRFGRALHWVRRDPRRSARLAWAVLLSAALLAGSSYLWSSSAREQRAELETNAFIASGQAGAALFQLREYADRVLHTAAKPEIAALATAAGPVAEAPRALKELHSGFATVFVVSRDGYIRHLLPRSDPALYKVPYHFRDYFEGASKLGRNGQRSAYVARAFRAERDGTLQFGVSAPLFDGKGDWTGALVAMVPAASVFGKVRMQDAADSGRVMALLGPRDIDRGGRRREEPRFVLLVHDGLRDGEEIAATHDAVLNAAFGHASPAGEQFSLNYVRPHQESDYEDPVRGFEGKWLAAFAPVGGTGYVMAVQSPRPGLLEASRRFAERKLTALFAR